MNNSPGDPIDEWRVISERAARATGYRARAIVVVRPARGFGLGAVLVLVALVAGGLLLRPTVGPAGGAPVVASTDDGTFRLELSTPHASYALDEAISPVARLTYLGPMAAVEIWHATKAVQFQIDEIDGPQQMDGGTRLPCISEPLTRGGAIEIPFAKAGSPDDPIKGFDLPWYQDPVLRLPGGVWRIVASAEITIGSCGGERHQLSVDNLIRVADGPATSAAPSAAPTVAVSPTPSPTLSADALAARELVRKYVDGLMTDHSDQSWGMLSDWSKRTVGGFATFSDAERRLKVFDPRIPVVADPTLDGAALKAALTGDRAADIASNADPDRAWVIVLRRPPSALAAAGDQTLVVAPVGGRNQIWLDTTSETYGAWPYPDGCPAFSLSLRRCRAVVEQAAQYTSIDTATASAIWLLPEPGCGGDPLAEGLILCTRSTSFVAGVRFDRAGKESLRQDVFCGVGPPTLVCSENPGIQAVDMHNGYWDVPCTGEPPDGCPKPIKPPTGAAALGARALRLATLDVPVGDVGHHEIEIGTAVLPGGVLSEGRMSIEQIQQGFLLDPGMVTMVVRSTDPSRPPFQNIYERGVWDHPETVRVLLVFDVAETSPDATIHVTGVEVR